MNNKTKIKRASILAFIIYIMINGFVWGLMKAYINSYNSINRDKLVMAQITDKPDGKEIKILGGSFIIPENNSDTQAVYTAAWSLMPDKIKAAAKLFMRIGQDTVQEALK